MSHFWLKPHEQALMDSATMTAHDYGHIGAFDIGTNTKTALKTLLGYDARTEDQIRPHKLVNWTRFYVGAGKQMSAKVLVRITKAQATMLKLSHQSDSLQARMMNDPTGEFWGNLLITQSYMPQTDYSFYSSKNPSSVQLLGYKCRSHVKTEIRRLLNGDGFGPTLDRVGTFADALPAEWRSAFVMVNFCHWYDANNACQIYEAFGDKRETLDEATAAAIFNGIFEQPITLRGQRWATDFWRKCQDVRFRQSVGIGK